MPRAIKLPEPLYPINPPNPPSTRNARTPETTKKTPNAVTFRLKDDRREAAHVLPDLGVWPRRERWAVDLLKKSEHVGSAVVGSSIWEFPKIGDPNIVP